MGGLTVVLFVAALWYTNHNAPIVGLVLLGFTFCVPMIWVVLAARDATDPDTPLRRFIPRIVIWLALGTAFLGVYWWNVDRRITIMEAGFAIFYLLSAYLAVRILDSKHKGPKLTSISGGNPNPPPRRQHPHSGKR